MEVSWATWEAAPSTAYQSCVHTDSSAKSAGDPMTGLRWSRRATTTIADELGKLGIAVSPNTVARLLHHMGYSLRVNKKQISTSSSPNRNLRFEYLAQLRDRFQHRHLPIVSVNSKKLELAGILSLGTPYLALEEHTEDKFNVLMFAFLPTTMFLILLAFLVTLAAAGFYSTAVWLFAMIAGLFIVHRVIPPAEPPYVTLRTPCGLLLRSRSVGLVLRCLLMVLPLASRRRSPE
jgi:hypothetical protein